MTISILNTRIQYAYLYRVLIILLFSTSGLTAQQVEYHELSAQEQADFSRWLGWVWGDGNPIDEDNLTGIRYSGPNSNPFDSRYNEVVDRLKTSALGMVLANGGTNQRRILEPWDYWNNSIPGGKVNDPQLLRDAVKNPNFLAGILDTEGGNCGNTNNNYYIDDHFYAPSHPDQTKQYGLLHFGPLRMIQLYHLLGSTYGLDQTAMQIGTQGAKYIYADEFERETAIMTVIAEYNNTKRINEAAMTIEEGKTKRVRIYIDELNWDMFRSFGFWLLVNSKALS